MKYRRIIIDKFLEDYKDATPAELKEAAELLKARGRKCIFVEEGRMLNIIALQNQINELKQNTKV